MPKSDMYLFLGPFGLIGYSCLKPVLFLTQVFKVIELPCNLNGRIFGGDVWTFLSQLLQSGLFYLTLHFCHCHLFYLKPNGNLDFFISNYLILRYSGLIYLNYLGLEYFISLTIFVIWTILSHIPGVWTNLSQTDSFV